MKNWLVRPIVMRILALAMCVLALGVFFAFAPRPVSAEDCQCVYGGDPFTPGACFNGQRCMCGSPPNCGCMWKDDANCARGLD